MLADVSNQDPEAPCVDLIQSRCVSLLRTRSSIQGDQLLTNTVVDLRERQHRRRFAGVAASRRRRPSGVLYLNLEKKKWWARRRSAEGLTLLLTSPVARRSNKKAGNGSPRRKKIKNMRVSRDSRYGAARAVAPRCPWLLMHHYSARAGPAQSRQTRAPG